MDKGRKYDIEKLKEDLKHPKNDLQRRKILEAGKKIQDEQKDGWLRGAREALIHERKQGRVEDSKYVSDEILKHKGLGRTTFSFDLSGIKFKK